MFQRGNTRVIIGLGNPGRQYERTRHNAGWLVLDELAKRLHASGARNRLRAEIIETRCGDDRLILAKPQTYMNESGKSVAQLLNWYKVKPEDCLIIVDDLDLPFGRLRLRAHGSAGGHNGLKSIIREIGTDAFPRLRVGIGRPDHRSGQALGHVLGNFSVEEQKQATEVFDASVDAIELWLNDGIKAAMNTINGVPSVISTRQESNSQ